VICESIQERGTLPLATACATVRISRCAYTAWTHRPVADADPLVEQIREIVNHNRRYGYRRVTATLNPAGTEQKVNHKRVLKTMRNHGFLCKKRKAYVKTTDSNHGLLVYPNLAKDKELTGLNQLWVADITYIHLLHGFVYLAVIIDRFSRKCIGWQLSRDIDVQLCIDALKRALASRPGMSIIDLIHHSDQGVQYASHEYTTVLKEHGIAISMSRRGNPYDNAYAESFFKTFKYEEVYVSEYASFEDALANIEKFIEEVYNAKRLHSAIGYQPPAEFEKALILKNHSC
jgi:transposase InsO family protein